MFCTEVRELLYSLPLTLPLPLLQFELLHGSSTALIGAAENGHRECMAMLIAAGANCNAKNTVRYRRKAPFPSP